MDKNEFSSRLSQLRREKGFSQKELGDMLGVSNKAISKWENGEALPKTETMLKLAGLMGIDGNELLGIGPAGGHQNTGRSDEQPSDEKRINEQIGRLQAENLALRSEIDFYDKKKRKTAICIGIALLAFAVIGVAAFFLLSQTDINNGRIADAGATGTKIEFSGMDFYPCTELQNRLLEFNQSGFLHSFEEKSAGFYAADGSFRNVTVQTIPSWKILLLKTNSGSYYYVNDVSFFEMKPENLSEVRLFDSSISDTPYLQYSDDYEFSKRLDTKLFCDMYASLQTQADLKITELYLGNRGRTVSVEFLNDALPELLTGEFFSDDKGNSYFYRYADGKSYLIDKELKYDE